MEAVVLDEDAHVAGEGEVAAGCLNHLARSTELVPPGLAFEMQTVQPRIGHAASLAGAGRSYNAAPAFSIRLFQLPVNTIRPEIVARSEVFVGKS
jgi:hypothetical protein